MPQTSHEFLMALQTGTADKSAAILVWHLVHRQRGGIKVDIAEPKEGWTLQVTQSPDARYMQLVAIGEPER